MCCQMSLPALGPLVFLSVATFCAAILLATRCKKDSGNNEAMIKQLPTRAVDDDRGRRRWRLSGVTAVDGRPVAVAASSLGRVDQVPVADAVRSASASRRNATVQQGKAPGRLLLGQIHQEVFTNRCEKQYLIYQLDV